VEYCFSTVDVFTDEIFAGAQIAVIPDAVGLSTATMQKIACEFNLSETVFVFPNAENENSRRMRIFSPLEEVDFAGHPVIATAYVLALTGQIELKAKNNSFVLEQNHGPVQVNISSDSGLPNLVQFSLKPEPIVDRFVPTDQEIAAFIGLKSSELESKKFRPMMVSCGLPYLIVPLCSYESVRAAKFNYSEWGESSAPATAVQEVLLFSNKTKYKNSDFHGRLLGPNIGFKEDPPIGSAIPAFTSYLCTQQHTRIGTYTFAIDRGTQSERRSLLHIEMDNKGKNNLKIRVGGQAVLVSEGKINIPDLM